eukprot:3467425-Prymnesium_polylepis.1
MARVHGSIARPPTPLQATATLRPTRPEAPRAAACHSRVARATAARAARSRASGRRRAWQSAARSPCARRAPRRSTCLLYTSPSPRDAHES